MKNNRINENLTSLTWACDLPRLPGGPLVPPSCGARTGAGLRTAGPFPPRCSACFLWGAVGPDGALLSGLSLFCPVSQPRLCPPLLRGPPPCPVGALAQLPLPEAPGRPQVRGLTAARLSPCCRPSSATRPSTCAPWGPSTSSARPQVSEAPGWVGAGSAGPEPLLPTGGVAASLRASVSCQGLHGHGFSRECSPLPPSLQATHRRAGLGPETSVSCSAIRRLCAR